MINIENEDVLRQYLLDRGVTKKDQAVRIKYFGGGVSGIVALVCTPDGELIVKQALAKLKVKADWFSDPSRMVIEKNGNEIYHKFMPENAPAVFFYDPENYIYGREAAPESCVMWKSQLLDGLLDYSVAKKAMESLAVIHEKCAYNSEIHELFKDKSFFYDLRISPYIEQVLKVHPSLQDFATPIISTLMNSDITLVHGDYSPKNILIDGRNICILDYEVAHFGHPAFDISFFINHFMLKTVKNSQWAGGYLYMARYMLDIYFDTITFMDKAELEAISVSLFALLFLARVDGKSPAEYITEEPMKEIIRSTAFTIINNGFKTFDQVFALVEKNIKEAKLTL